MSSTPPLLTWNHERQIADRIAEVIQRQDADAPEPHVSTLLGGQFAAISDKCFNVASLLMAITGRVSRFPMTVWDVLEGEFETEAGFALAQLPLQLLHLSYYCANEDNEYDAEFGAAVTLIHRLESLPKPPILWPEPPTQRIAVLESIARALPAADLPRPFGATEATAFRRCWLQPIETWPYRTLTPPPETLLASLIPEVLTLGNLAFQFWAGLSHFTWGGIPKVFDGSEHELCAVCRQHSEPDQLVQLLEVFLQIAAFDLPSPDTGRRFSDLIDLVGKWDFSK